MVGPARRPVLLPIIESEPVFVQFEPGVWHGLQTVH
jgi:hypothetical protein